jgi:hypothetical protein
MAAKMGGKKELEEVPCGGRSQQQKSSVFKLCVYGSN